jgi:hypothetical protein
MKSGLAGFWGYNKCKSEISRFRDEKKPAQCAGFGVSDDRKNQAVCEFLATYP